MCYLSEGVSFFFNVFKCSVVYEDVVSEMHEGAQSFPMSLWNTGGQNQLGE